MNSTIPIIILNWNGIEDTLECVESVLRQTYDNIIIYLVDNGSDNHNVRILKDKYNNNPKVELVFNPKNLGFTRANNEILNKIITLNNYQYVVLLNNDTLVPENLIDNLIQSAIRNSADMISCKMINYYQRDIMDNAGHYMLNTGEILPIGHKHSIDKYNEVFENIGACGGACLYSVKMLKDIGTFDEYFNTGYEDAELGLRAFISDYKLIYEPSAIVYHKISKSVDKVLNYNYFLKIQLNIYYTYLTLMPLSVIVYNSISVISKTIAVIISSLIFFRFKYLKLLLHSYYIIIFRDFQKVIIKRKEINRNKHIPFIKIIHKQDFFLRRDLKNFLNYLLKREKTIFERY